MIDSVIHILLTLLFPPLLLGVINRTKALFAGRTGQPILQAYYDLAKLARKGTVFSNTTSWVFRAGPVVGLGATLVASLLIPLGEHHPPLSFSGDMILFAYLFGLARFCTTAAAWTPAPALRGWVLPVKPPSPVWPSRRSFSPWRYLRASPAPFP